jgi:hypothetical protein
MSKIKPTILYHIEEHSNLTACFLEPIWKEFFDIAPIDPLEDYDPKTCVLWVKHLRTNDWHLSWASKGYKIIIDHFWDSATNLQPDINSNILTMRMPNWSWFNESLWYQSLGYQNYQRRAEKKYCFLMLMRKVTKHRDMIWKKSNSVISTGLCSYVHRGVTVPGDIDTTDVRHQRFINSQWYNSTQFSIAVDSTIDEPHFVSEKIFRPMAFQHPFVIWGICNSLTYLKSLGFETFDHVIDESYDNEPVHIQRLEKIITVVKELIKDFKDGDLFGDAISREKIHHNFYRFYHPDVRKWFIQDAVMPILEFVES